MAITTLTAKQEFLLVWCWIFRKLNTKADGHRLNSLFKFSKRNTKHVDDVFFVSAVPLHIVDLIVAPSLRA